MKTPNQHSSTTTTIRVFAPRKGGGRTPKTPQLSRLLWRYRHHLLPVTFYLGLLNYSTVLHSCQWWASAAVFTLFTAIATALAMVPKYAATLTALASRLDKPKIKIVSKLAGQIRRLVNLSFFQRCYAVTVTAATGVWITLAGLFGPDNELLLILWLCCLLAAGVPRWIHYRWRSRIKLEGLIDAWPDKAAAVGLEGSTVTTASLDRFGYSLSVRLKPGSTPGDAIKQRSAIESALAVRPGAVRVRADQYRADRVALRVIEHDPHAKKLTYPYTDQPAMSSISSAASLGLFEDTTEVRLDLVGRHVLVAGVTGSGKSGLLNVIMANLAGCGDVQVWGVDLQAGVTLTPWARNLSQFAVTPVDALALLHGARSELDRRGAVLAKQGLKAWKATPENPAIVIIVDEFAELPGPAWELVDAIGQRGRALAVTLVAATQRPTQQTMGYGSLRSQMGVRICCTLTERRDTDLVLGQGAWSNGWHPETLTRPGMFLIRSPQHARPHPARAWHMTGTQIGAVSRRHARPASRTPLVGSAPTPVTAVAIEAARGRVESVGGRWDARSNQGAQAALWDGLSRAGADGISVKDLTAMTGMSRQWVYVQLAALNNLGKAVHLKRGAWTATQDQQGRSGS